MSAGYSGTPLARKLGIREGHEVLLDGAPASIEGLLDPLPPAVDLVRSGPFEGADDAKVGRGSGLAVPDDAGPPDCRFDVVLLFCRDAANLGERLREAIGRLRWDGGLWVCWPKKSSPLHVGLAREEVREAGLEMGLVDNKVCAVDEDWSGLRFVVRREDRPKDTDRGGPEV